MFKQHLEMIGSYEPISKKARFFNTYLKSLKGKLIRRPSMTNYC